VAIPINSNRWRRTKIGEGFEHTGVDRVNGEPVHAYTIARP
jgi:hypothetical protein